MATTTRDAFPPFCKDIFQWLLEELQAINKLTTENFIAWRRDLEDVFNSHPHAYRIIIGECEPRDRDYDKDLDEKLGLLLQACIVYDPTKPNNVASTLDEIQEPVMASELFRELETAHTKLCTKMIHILELEFAFRLRYRGSAKEFSDRFFELVEKFEVFGNPMSNNEKLLRTRMLFAKTKQFEPIMREITGSPDRYPTAKDWFDKAIFSESLDNNPQSRSLATRGTNQRFRETRICHLCQKQGHLIRNCPENKTRQVTFRKSQRNYNRTS